MRVAGRPLHFIWVIDCSSRGNDSGKMHDVDRVVTNCLPALREGVDRYGAGIQMLMRVLCYSHGARWHIEQPTDVHEFRWECPPLDGTGRSDLGAAFDQLAVALQTETMGQRGMKPHLVLMTDGRPTDDWEAALGALRLLPWFKYASKNAVAVGADANMDLLLAFLANPERAPLRVTDAIAEQVMSRIVWASVPSSPFGWSAFRPFTNFEFVTDETSVRESSEPPQAPEDGSDWFW